MMRKEYEEELDKLKVALNKSEMFRMKQELRIDSLQNEFDWKLEKSSYYGMGRERECFFYFKI